MQHIAIMEPMTAEFVEAYMHEHGLPEPVAEFLAHHIEQPQEDYYTIDKKPVGPQYCAPTLDCFANARNDDERDILEVC